MDRRKTWFGRCSLRRRHRIQHVQSSGHEPPRVLVVIAALVLWSGTVAAETVLHGSPLGNDAWWGQLAAPATDRSDGPLASLTEARDCIRDLRMTAAVDGPIRVVVADGSYSLTATFVLEPRDSGTADAPIVYEAAARARPVFSGGRQITGWQANADGTGRFEQLFVNGRRATRARSPNGSCHPVAEAWEATTDGRTEQGLILEPEAFASLEKVSPAELPGVFVAIHHKWDVSGRFITRLDPERWAIVTMGHLMKPWNRWDRKSLVVLENARNFLDAPGGWFLDHTGTLWYRPLPGETPNTAETILPMVGTWIRFAGDPHAGRLVEHVTIRGLTFHHGQWLMPSGGFEPQQAAVSIDAMVMADGTRHVTFENCEFGHFGRYGLWFRRGCRDCIIRTCHIFDCGAGGMRIGEPGQPANETESSGGIRIEDCIIRHGGRILAPAVGIWIGSSADNAIVHKEIADFLQTGISVGWRWGYDTSVAKRNTIAHNHIHHLGYGPLADLGGIYTLGPSEGTVVSGNVIHHIHSRRYGGWGLYPDEGSSGILYENNLIYDTKDGSFHQHYGRYNVVRNNVFIDSVERQIYVTKAEAHRSFTFVNIIIAWRIGAALSGPWEKAVTETGRNCWWRHGGGPVDFLGNSLGECQAAGHEQGSVAADPRFVSAPTNDYRIADDSPAIAIGFKPVDWSAAGVRGDEA